MTVTMNAVDPEIGSKIYSWIRLKGRIYRGHEAAALLIFRQMEAIGKLKADGFIVKVNTVILPGINTEHIPAIAKTAAKLGADVMNCIP